MCRYHSVRIDPVHYCQREAWLAERRKKTSRFDRNGVVEDPAQARLRLFRRTVRDDPTRIGKTVQSLKLPYMIRESSQVELAQTIAVLPNLHYVDLPEGMFSDEPNYSTLRLEVQARCPNIRKMTYFGGSEHSFSALASGRVWTNIEVLDLKKMNVDPMTMRAVLGALTSLRALKVSETESFSDEILVSGDGMVAVPALEELVLKDTPNVTSAGLVDYLAWQETQQALKVLTLKDTGTQVINLQDILIMATSLEVLAFQSTVIEPFPAAAGIPLLASGSLKTLRYEIAGRSQAWAGITSGYNTYLASSILADGLPSLRRLYVHDETLPDQIQGLPPPNAAFAGGHIRSASHGAQHAPKPSFHLTPASANTTPAPPSLAPRRPVSRVPPTNRFSSNNPFAARLESSTSPPPTPHTLEIFTKSDDFGKWNFARITTSRSLASPSPRRPVSSYGLATDVAGQGWDHGDARRSVVVGNGAAGFLAVPAQQDQPAAVSEKVESDDWRPRSSHGDARRNRDLWR